MEHLLFTAGSPGVLSFKYKLIKDSFLSPYFYNQINSRGIVCHLATNLGSHALPFNFNFIFDGTSIIYIAVLEAPRH